MAENLTVADDLTDSGGADLIDAVAAESNEELVAGLEKDFGQMTAAQGRFLVRLGEMARREIVPRRGGHLSRVLGGRTLRGLASPRPGRMSMWPRRPPRCPSWWGRCARGRSPWTRSEPCSMWPRLRPKANCVRRPRSAVSVS